MDFLANVLASFQMSSYLSQNEQHQGLFSKGGSLSPSILRHNAAAAALNPNSATVQSAAAANAATAFLYSPANPLAGVYRDVLWFQMTILTQFNPSTFCILNFLTDPKQLF